MGDGRRTDVLTPALAARYAATFDRKARATGPQGIHWCLNTPDAATATLGPDGHPLRAEHADLPRRMWASSDVTFHRPLVTGATVERASRIVESEEKSGKSGRLLFVTVAHDIHADGALAIEELQHIVYREPPQSDAPAPAPRLLPPAEWIWERTVLPSPALLFRYSALTFNSHRIHYDLPYARETEGYPGLVVHGPLMASLLLDLVDRELGPDALARFAFRAACPAFAGAPIRLLGRREGSDVHLAVADEAGGTIMTAQGQIAAA